MVVEVFKFRRHAYSGQQREKQPGEMRSRTTGRSTVIARSTLQRNSSLDNTWWLGGWGVGDDRESIGQEYRIRTRLIARYKPI